MAGGIFALPRVDRRRDDWSVRSLRSILRSRSERNRPELPLLTVARERGVFVRSVDDANHNSIPDDLSNYKVARAGDLVINKMKAWQGSLGLAPLDGIVSPAYFVFHADFAVPQFGEYLLRSKPYVAKFGAASDGVRIGQWDLNIPRMRSIEVYLPPADEQTAIVKYLAHANARIDKAIDAKRRLISLLDEQKCALATDVLSAGGRWKPVGLRGDRHADLVVPPGMKVLRTGRFCRISTGLDDSGNAQDEGAYPFFVRGREILRSNDYQFDTEAVLTPGDGQGGVGKVFHYFKGRFQAHQRVYVFHDFDAVDVKYFYWYLSTFFRPYALSQSSTVTMESLRRPVLASFPVLIPSGTDQAYLVEKIESAVALADRQIAVAVREIELLREFRARLTADVVTGQVDVRAISAALPEAPDSFDIVDPALDDDLEEALSEGED